MVDGDGRMSYDDVEMFKLEPSIRISPSSASVGDRVNVFAQDFPNERASLSSLKIANQEVLDIVTNLTSGNIGGDGSATATFDMPGSISGSPLEGATRIDAAWGDVSEDATITLAGSILRLSVAEARANESVTIQGEGFGSGRGYACTYNITIDGVPLEVDSDSVVSRSGCDPDSPNDDNKSGDAIEVSNAGQFVATVYLWNGSGDTNPALISGEHKIRVQDSKGFYGTAAIIIKDPSMTILPDTLGPRDHLTITGTDWPVDNLDSRASVESVVIKVQDDPSRTTPRTYTVCLLYTSPSPRD